jgi:REP element-mobilizing transposase RayT
MHCTLSTKERPPLIKPDLESRLWPYIGGIAGENRMKALAIGGTSDHLDALVSLPATMSFAKAVQLIKGGSSKWIHDIFARYRKFEWQEVYGTFRVSASQMDRTIAYINNQKEHHRKRTFEEESIELLDKHGVEYDRRYVFRSGQPSVSRTAELVTFAIPPMNRWAIVIRPLRGLTFMRNQLC